MHLTEHWKDIEGYEGIYQISSHGRVKTLARVCRGRLLIEMVRAQSTHYKGHKTIYLNSGGERKKFFVHRLVAIHFIPNPETLPLVNHIDSNKQNNHISNLEWCTEKYNTQHYYEAKKERQYVQMPTWVEPINEEDLPF